MKQNLQQPHMHKALVAFPKRAISAIQDFHDLCLTTLVNLSFPRKTGGEIIMGCFAGADNKSGVKEKEVHLLPKRPSCQGVLWKVCSNNIAMPT